MQKQFQSKIGTISSEKYHQAKSIKSAVSEVFGYKEFLTLCLSFAGMTIKLIYIGKTFQSFISEGCKEFEARLKKYTRLEVFILADVKSGGSMEANALKKAEAQLVLKQLKPDDWLVLLDERGDQFSSVQFSKNLQDKMNKGLKTVVFLVGGAFGFDEQLYERANEKLSFSKMTFSHQMIRLFLAEQIYRAFTILKNEPYHNE